MYLMNALESLDIDSHMKGKNEVEEEYMASARAKMSLIRKYNSIHQADAKYKTVDLWFIPAEVLSYFIFFILLKPNVYLYLTSICSLLENYFQSITHHQIAFKFHSFYFLHSFLSFLLLLLLLSRKQSSDCSVNHHIYSFFFQLLLLKYLVMKSFSFVQLLILLQLIPDFPPINLFL